MKDEFLANLLSTNKRVPDSKLVSVVGDEDGSLDATPPSVPSVEGPSMMEMMMLAHQEAKKEKEIAATEEVRKTTKTFGGGFKKGFFGNEKKTEKKVVKEVKEVNEKDAYLSWMQNKTTTDTTEASSSSSSDISDKKDGDDVIPTIRMNVPRNTSSATASITADVQRAMTEDEPQMLKQLKQGEWVTPDLLKIFQENEIIRNGLKNPKCTAAMELMQKNPKEAKKKFEGHYEVDVFMREFGRVMSGHFDKLGAIEKTKTDEKSNNGGNNGNSSNSSSSNGAITAKKPTGPLIQEATTADEKKIENSSGNNSGYGVLQAEAMERHKLSEASRASTSSDMSVDRNRKGADGLTDEEREAELVKKIVTDTELSSLLLDLSFQQILKECGDPIKFQQHMSNPDTARKIKKMFDSGLVATAK